MVGLSPRAKRVLELAIDEARLMGHGYVGTEHLLLGLLREGEGVAAQVLENLGIDLDRARSEVLELLGGRPPGPSQRQEAPGPAGPGPKEGRERPPSSNGRDLTVMASEGKLDPVIGRRTKSPG